MTNRKDIVFIAIRSPETRRTVANAIGCGKFSQYVIEIFYRIKDAFGVWEKKADAYGRVIFITDQEDLGNGRGSRSLLLTLREKELEFKVARPATIIFIGRENAKHTLKRLTEDIKGNVECIFVPIMDKDIDPFIERLQHVGV